MYSKFLLASSLCLLAYSHGFRGLAYDQARKACVHGLVDDAAKKLGCPPYVTSVCNKVIGLYNNESLQEAAKILGCPSDVESICQAVIDRHNKPGKFSHQEVFDLPSVTKVERETDAQGWARTGLSAVSLLINERPETMFIPDAQLLILDLSAGNYGLKPGDELSRLNLLSLFQAVEVTLNIGQSIRLASIAAMAGGITSLIISGGHKDLLDLRECVELKHLKLSDMSSVNVVDVSGLVVLNTLEFEGCADLAVLNASGCVELSEIHGCSGLTGLNTLDVGDSKFLNLDLSNSVGLQSLIIPGGMVNLNLPRFTDISCTCKGTHPVNITIPGTGMMFAKK
jgi:hypothetical protein